jgi:F0F1-type ATP synthase assembly protein I
MPREPNWATFLSMPHLARLVAVYAAFMFLGGVLTFAIYLGIERPEAGLSFLAGMAFGMLSALGAYWFVAHGRSQRATNLWNEFTIFRTSSEPNPH